MKHLIIILVSAFLVACVPNEVPADSNNRDQPTVFKELGFKIQLPDKLNLYANKEFASTIPEPASGGYILNGDEIAIDDADLTIYDDQTDCSNSKMGVTKNSSLVKSTDYIWGNVDIEYLSPHNRPIEGVLCLPPTQGCTPSDIWSGDCNFGQAAFSLCAKSSKRTVMLCLRQIHEDRSAAQMIFESFRWIE